MKTWLSASEIASLALPGLPASKRSVIRVAQRCGWLERTGLSRTRAGNGGGYEFSIDLLPADARAHYVARHVGAVDIPASLARSAAREDGAAQLNGTASDARDARLALLTQADRYAETAKLSRKRADAHFADLYNAGTIVAADWIKAEVKTLTSRTLRRWRAEVRKGNTTRLAVDRSAARKGTGLLDRANGGEVRTFLLALLAKQPQLTAFHLRTIACDRFDNVITVADRRYPMPPIRTFQRALNIWRDAYRNELKAVRDPDGFKSSVRFAARVAQPATRLNEIWQIDASPADILATDGRYSLYLCIDVYSRRLVGLVTKTPRAASVGLLLRKAIKAWGVPERIKTDNGSDFIAHETRRLLAALGIEHETSAPFSPEQKGHIERAIGTLQRGLMRTLEGFIGHSVADRKIIEGRKSFARRLGESAEDMFEVTLTAADLQQRIDEWCTTIYANAAHAGLKGQSPFAVAAMSAGSVCRIKDERALDMLLTPVAGKDGCRTVTKSGIRIDGTYYIAGHLNVGDDVHVRMDPADLGRVHVFTSDQLTYLGEAIAPELLGIDPAAAINRVRAEQKQLIDERMNDARREARRIKAKDIAPAIHRQAAIEAGSLFEFPKPSRAHDTPQLEAMRSAASRGDTPERHSDEIAAFAARLRAEAEAEAEAPATVTPLRTAETPHHRWNKARAIEVAIAAKEYVAPDDLIWLGGYRNGPEYRGFSLTYGPAETATPAEAGHV